MAAMLATEVRLSGAILCAGISAYRTRLARKSRIDEDKCSSCLVQGPEDGHPHRIWRNADKRTVQAALCTDVFARFLDRAFGRLRHVLQIQIFHGHPPEFLCDGVSRLLHEVLTNVADAAIVFLNLLLQMPSATTRLPLVEGSGLVELCELLTGLLVVAELLLKDGDSMFVLLDGFNVKLEHRTVGERHRLGNAQVNADLTRTTRSILGAIHLSHDGYVPAAAIDGDRHLLDPALDRPRLSESHEARLRNADSTVGLVPIGRFDLRNTEGIAVAPGLELRKTFPLRLEVLDGSIQVHQALLKRLRRSFTQPCLVILHLPQNQPAGQFRVLQEWNVLLKALLLQLNRLVDDKTPTAGSLSEKSLLFSARHQFKHIGDIGFHDDYPTPSFSKTYASRIGTRGRH